MTRKEVIGKLRGLVSSCPLKHDEWQAIEVAIKALKEQRPHGEWEFVQRGKFVDMVCPFCKDVCVDGIAYNYSIDEVKETIESDTFSIHGKADLPNFCSNCGADMRKGGDEK